MFDKIKSWYEELEQKIYDDLHHILIKEFDTFFEERGWKRIFNSTKMEEVDEGESGIKLEFSYEGPRQTTLTGKLFVSRDWQDRTNVFMVTEFRKASGSKGFRRTYHIMEDFYKDWDEYAKIAVESNYLVSVGGGVYVKDRWCYWKESDKNGRFIDDYSIGTVTSADPIDIKIETPNKQYRRRVQSEQEADIEFWASMARGGGIGSIMHYIGKDDG